MYISEAERGQRWATIWEGSPSPGQGARLQIPCPFTLVPRLAELKVINEGKTKFPRGKEGKGVGKRGEALTTEYEQVLRDFDVLFRLQNENRKQWID